MSPLKKSDAPKKKNAGDWAERQTRLSGADFECAAQTHIGFVRSSNQDRYAIHPLPGGAILLALADGLGGDKAGDLASDTIRKGMEAVLYIPENQEAETLLHLARTLDKEIRDAGQCDPDLNGMGSTLIMALVQGARVFWVHVGDSRIYLFQNSRLTQITEDQTLARFLIAENIVLPEDAARHYSRHVMEQYVGCGFCEPEHGSFAVFSGDWLILMSDGVYRCLSEAAIIAILEKPESPDRKCRKIVQAVLKNGGKDNLTILMFHRL